MKIRNTQHNRSSKSNAFTLIEMIGVLAVIAILAALLIPKVFEAINNARVNNAAVSYNTVKAALTDHYAKYGTILSSNGTVLVLGSPGAVGFDKTLLTEGFLDKPFQVKVGDNVTTHIEVVAGQAIGATPTATDSAYDLDGSAGVGINENDAGPATAAVVQAIISGVTMNDAKDLNDRLDGPLLGTTLPAADLVGRVKYGVAGVGGTTTVYIYVTHR